MNFERLKGIYKKNNAQILPIKAGMRLELHEKVGEGVTQRVWRFKGLVIEVKKPNHVDGTFTIRGEVARTTIEKIYPLSFTNFEKVLLLDEHKVRRSKLFFMRDKIGKDAKLKSIIDGERKEIDLLKIAKIYSEEEKVEEKIQDTKDEDKEETKIGEKSEEKKAEDVKENTTEKVDDNKDTKEEKTEEKKKDA